METEENLPELPEELVEFLKKPFGGLFSDSVQTEIIQEIVADPYGSYNIQYFEEITGASETKIKEVLNNLINVKLIEKDDQIYKANLNSKKLVALTFLSFASIDDRDGTDIMDSAISDYYERELKSVKIIIPNEMWETEMGKNVQKDAEKIMRSIEEHQKNKEIKK